MPQSEDYRAGYQAGLEAGKKKGGLELEPVLAELTIQNKNLDRIARVLEDWFERKVQGGTF